MANHKRYSAEEKVRILREHPENNKSVSQLAKEYGISPKMIYQWKKHRGKANAHNGRHPKKHWLLPEERAALWGYCRSHGAIGYRRLTYRMPDDEDVAPRQSR